MSDTRKVPFFSPKIPRPLEPFREVFPWAVKRNFLAARLGLYLWLGLLKGASGLLDASEARGGEPPRDNPVASFYDGPEGYPAWTDAIRWDQVLDMSSYAKGANDFEKFERARDELAALGGGVLYYPAGIYDFKDMPASGPSGRGLMLRRGIVLRGQAPEGKPHAVKDPLNLKTKFLFPFEDRSEVALDVGERARMKIPGAVVWETTSNPKKGPPQTVRNARDLFLSVEIEGGKWRAEKPLAAVHTESIPCTMAIQEEKDGLTIRFDLEIKVQEGPLKASGLAQIQVEAGRIRGRFEGKSGSLATAGPVEGAIEKIRPETPRDWNLIGLRPEPGGSLKDVHYCGICWIHLTGATIWFGPDLEWGRTWREAGSWKSSFIQENWASRQPDGTHPQDPFCGGLPAFRGAGKGRLIFGCQLDHAVQTNNGMNAGVNHPTAPPEAKEGFGPNGFFTHKFGARIGAYGSRIFAANNHLPYSSGRNFKFRQKTIVTGGEGNKIRYGPIREQTVLFDYNFCFGLDINKEMLGLVQGPSLRPDSPGGLFEEGVAVRDNFVYNYGNKGFNISGRWVTILHNRNERMVFKREQHPGFLGGWRSTLDGFSEVSGGGGGSVSDSLSRAFDLAGQNLWVEGNTFNNTGSTGNDGEGILCQSHGGTQIYSWALTRNRHEKGLGTAGYLGGYRVLAEGFLIAWNQSSGWVGVLGSQGEKDCAYVENQALGGIQTSQEKTALIVPPQGKPRPPLQVAAEIYQDDAIKVTYMDGGEDEIGFKIQRAPSPEGPWITIAYRPPQIQKSPLNPPAWIDFLASPNRPWLYRVVAIGVEDGDLAASPPTAPLTLPKQKR